jgi:hypothetical protein
MLPRLPLPPGSYTVSLSAGVGSELLDMVPHALELTVAEGDWFESGVRPAPSHPTVLVPQSWSVGGTSVEPRSMLAADAEH